MRSNGRTGGRGEEVLFKILWDIVGIQNVCVHVWIYTYVHTLYFVA